jgi:quercetin 2,3-dioxygenase
VSNLEPRPAEITASAGVIAADRADLLDGRDVPFGRHTVVRRLLPHTNRRMVGAWCFLDHFGPERIAGGPGMQVPPHPHCGLQTVTWLVEGEVLHRDSLGSLVMIEPGQVNLMTAGRGIAHSEESPEGHGPVMHGLQLWVALPADEVAIDPRFEHHEGLPVVELDGMRMTVAIGSLLDAVSPAMIHSPLVGAEIIAYPGSTAAVSVRPDFEHAIVVMSGALSVSGASVEPGSLLYLGDGRSTLQLEGGAEGTRAFLIGGEPFAEELVMWWNFVGRSHEDIVAAREDWSEHRRFGEVGGYAGDRLPAPAMPTTRLKPRGRKGRPM